MKRSRSPETAVDLSRGVTLLRDLEPIHEEDASGDLAETFEDIRDTMRSPSVDVLFCSLAAASPFMEAAWQYVATTVGSHGFEERGDRLRAAAADGLGDVPVGLALELPDDEAARVRGVVDGFHYVLPKLALVAELLDRVARDDARGSVRLDGDRLPRGAPRDIPKVPLLVDDALDGAVRRTFKDIQRTHDHPVVAPLYRSLANWPLVMQTVWGTVAPAVGTDAYLDRRAALQQKAQDLVAEVHLEGVGRDLLLEEDAQGLRDLLAVFRLRILPDLVQDVTCIKAALDGPRSARTSRFSATRARPKR